MRHGVKEATDHETWVSEYVNIVLRIWIKVREEHLQDRRRVDRSPVLVSCTAGPRRNRLLTDAQAESGRRVINILGLGLGL